MLSEISRDPRDTILYYTLYKNTTTVLFWIEHDTRHGKGMSLLEHPLIVGLYKMLFGVCVWAFVHEIKTIFAYAPFD